MFVVVVWRCKGYTLIPETGFHLDSSIKLHGVLAYRRKLACVKTHMRAVVLSCPLSAHQAVCVKKEEEKKVQFMTVVEAECVRVRLVVGVGRGVGVGSLACARRFTERLKRVCVCVCV